MDICKFQEKHIFLVLLGTLLLFSIISLSQIYANEPLNSIVINPDTNKLYVSNSDNKSIFVIDGRTNKILATILVGKQQEAIFNAENITQVATIMGTAGGIATAIIGLSVYRQSQILKKKDILKDIVFPLKKEFDKSPQIKIAKLILDDYAVPVPFGKDGGVKFYHINDLPIILRNHMSYEGGVLEPFEVEIRKSFDSFLNFLTTLEYLYSIQLLLTEKEIYPFRKYINRAGMNNAIIKYVKIYQFPLKGALHHNLSNEL
jgi:YVTN family beta-propeller protein